MADSGRRVLDEQERRAPRLNIHTSAYDAGEAEAYYDGIGAELRAERIRCGLSLDEVAQRLRIRLSHLEAIEEGRFGDLPGRIYAIGFLRSYAEFLGADGDVCISMFKAEAGPGGHSRKLVFPVPAEENRRPGLITLLVSVLLAGAVYGGWYMLQERETRTADLVPEVPARITEQLGQAEGQSGAVAAERPAVAVLPAPSEAETSVDLAVVGRNVTTEPEAEAPLLADETAAAPDSELEAGASNEPATAPATDETVSVAEAPAPSAEDEVEETVQLAAVAPPPPIPSIQPEITREPRVLGIANRNSRVTVRAVSDTQITVTQSTGGIVLPSRSLKAGDSYRAPDRDGIILQGNNIAQLEILVDGKLIGRADELAAPADALLLNAGLLASLID